MVCGFISLTDGWWLSSTNQITLASIIISMDLFGLSLRESNPRALRHTTSNLSSFFKTTMGGAFLSFFQETLSRKPTVQQNEISIRATIKKMNEIIETVDQHISQRLQLHEREVFSIVKEEVEEMKEETARIISQLNERINQKNADSELWYLNNELDYFKNIAFKLYQENKELKIKTKILEKRIRDDQSEKVCIDQAMQNIRKKYLREKGKNQQEKRVPREGHAKGKSLEEFIKNNRTDNRSGELLLLEEDPLQNQSRIEINMSNNPKPRDNFTFDPPSSLQNEQEIIPSLSLNNSDHNFNSLPPVHFVKVESYLCNEDSNSMDDHNLSSQICSKIIEDQNSILNSIREASVQRETHNRGTHNRGIQNRGTQNRGTQTQDIMVRIRPPPPQMHLPNNSHNPPQNVLPRAKRCNTEKNIELGHLSVGDSNSQREKESGRERQTFRVVNSKKHSKNIMYMSNALVSNRLKVESLMAPRQKYSRDG